MSTTALIVEVVIIGLQVLVWMSLLVLLIFGYGWLDVSKLKDWATIISLGLIALSYTIGIIYSSLLRVVFLVLEAADWWPFHIPLAPTEMRAYILIKNKDASESLERSLHQSSLLRATAPNLLLTGILVLSIVSQQIGFSWRVFLFISALTILLTAVAFFAWIGISSNYYRLMTNVYHALKDEEGNTKTDAT